MGMQRKLWSSRKKNYALRTGHYKSGSPAGFGLQNERLRRGLIKASAEKMAKYKEMFK